jgi:hypothetical protein
MKTAPTEDSAHSLIERCSRYLEPGPDGLHYYEYWIASAEESSPGMSELVRLAALRSLDAKDPLLVRSSVQALACTGHAEDIALLESMSANSEPAISSEASAAIALITHRGKSIDALLAEVVDLTSFVAYARALAKERVAASAIEAQNPERYSLDGALGWKNADIPSFIYAGLSALDALPESAQPTWAVFARFLYHGKEIE